MTVFPESLAEKIIAEKIQEWDQKRKLEKARKDRGTIELYPFLTISRDFGCREEEIVPLLEKRLGWKIYGRSLLDTLAKRESLSRNFMETLDEHSQNLVDNWINFLIHSGSILQKDYVMKISRLMKVIVAQESAIILGRGANYIFEDKTEGLRIRLTGRFQYRVQNIARLRSLPEKEAEKLVRETDQERAEFIDKYFNRPLHHCSYYDIEFNTEKVSNESLCKVVELLLEEKKAR